MLLRIGDFSRTSFAKVAGIPPSTINSLYDKGYSGIKLDTVKKIADFFGVSIDYLMDDNQNKPHYPEGTLYGAIYQILIDQNITVSQLAQQCGINDFVLRTILTQKQNQVSANIINKLSDGLKLPIGYFLGHKEGPTAKAHWEQEAEDFEVFINGLSAVYPAIREADNKQIKLLRGIKIVLDSEFRE